jgi:hypothetical protein
MNLTIFGTCRLDKIENHNNLNNEINYTHSTKEIIQLIKFLKGELLIEEPYNILCFRTAICNNRHIYYSQKYNELFSNSEICILEICSNKKYIHNGYYLHHLPFDKKWHEFNHSNFIRVVPEYISNEIVIEKQTDEEIENDILEIQEMLYPKKIIIVSHYNSKINGEYMESRNHLINLLDNICKKHDIHFVNPTNVLCNLTQEETMTPDLGHYTSKGIDEFSKYMNDFINRTFYSIKDT